MVIPSCRPSFKVNPNVHTTACQLVCPHRKSSSVMKRREAVKTLAQSWPSPHAATIRILLKTIIRRQPRGRDDGPGGRRRARGPRRECCSSSTRHATTTVAADISSAHISATSTLLGLFIYFCFREMRGMVRKPLNHWMSARIFLSSWGTGGGRYNPMNSYHHVRISSGPRHHTSSSRLKKTLELKQVHDHDPAGYGFWPAEKCIRL